MKTTVSAMALIISLGLAGGALAQSPPSGGMNAKGNAPLKHPHTVNDGAARAGANSFTQGEARAHIAHSGYTDVSPLAKGADGVWRGTAMRGGARLNVGLDYKGNVSEAGAAAKMTQAGAAMNKSSDDHPMVGGAAVGMTHSTLAGASTSSMRHPGRHHRRRHHTMARCAHPGPNGVACSGADRNHNGVSDKEDRAMRAGSHP